MAGNAEPKLPDGFVLDNTSPDLPDGFVLDEKAGLASDIGNAAVSGLKRGAAGVAATPGLLDTLGSWMIGQTAGRVENLVKTGSPDALTVADVRKRRELAQKEGPNVGAERFLTSDNTEALANKLPGADTSYQPQTTAGEYTKTIGEFAPAALLSPGNALQRSVQVIVPAVTSETAGQVARKVSPDLEPYARLAGAVVGGVGAGIASAPRSAETAIREGLQNATPRDINRAQVLMQDAARQGVTLSWDEAIQAVTNGATRLSDLRRVVENSRGGGDVFKPIMAQRPGQVQQAGDAAIGALSPQQLGPTQVGVRSQAAAEGTIADTQAAINRMTRPDYQAVEASRVGAPVSNALATDPIYQRTLQEIRNDPTLNRTIAHLPDDSGGVIDLVQRRIREQADNARMPGQANSSNLRAANLEDARTAPITAVEAATGGAGGAYDRARQNQAWARNNILEPMNQGPLGQISRTADAGAQGTALLPSRPLPNSHVEVADTVRNIAARDPQAAQGLIHSVVRQTFDEATQGLASGPNQFGGAKFAAALTGNTQQARNLEAAVRALPNGDVRWEGFNRFIEVMRATGWRPQPGSQTAFNQAIQEELKNGSLIGTAAEAAKTGGTSILKRVMQWREQANLSGNTEEIARILTDPNSGPLLARLAQMPPGSRQAQAVAARLVYLGYAGKNSGSGTAE